MIEINRVLFRGSKFGQDAQREAYFDCDKHLKELLNFGYEIIDEECYKKVNGGWRKYTILARTSMIPNHDKLCALEKEYEMLRKSKKEVPHANGWVAFFLFLVFLFPGFIYLSKKKKEKNAVIEENKHSEERIARILDQAWGLVKKR